MELTFNYFFMHIHADASSMGGEEPMILDLQSARNQLTQGEA